uniref:BHLH domain-containing protein n=1 Tax=Plectus sambesii TaxID=2011161 RepID=A0A914XMF4_9BILA
MAYRRAHRQRNPTTTTAILVVVVVAKKDRAEPLGDITALDERRRGNVRDAAVDAQTRSGAIRPAFALHRPSFVIVNCPRPLVGAVLFHAQIQPPLWHPPFDRPAICQSGRTRSTEQSGRLPIADRRRKKPLMEKKRRQRFNSNLGELMMLVLDKDQAGSTKVEKADVLEHAVRYLRNVENQRLVSAIVRDRSVSEQFLAGFGDCKKAVENFVRKNDSNGFDREI